MLKIIKAEEPIVVDRINLCIYAQPGVGKTTLAFTAEAPLLLDTDNGSYRASNRKDVVRVGTWSDIANISAEDLASYKTVILDTAGRALDFISADLIRENPKNSNGGALSLKGFGLLKGRFAEWKNRVNTFGKDVILICHMDEQRSGDDVIERLDVQGGSKGEIYKSVDAMGRIFIREKKRVLDFSPRENSFGKNPANLDVLEIPNVAKNNHFLGDVIASIKAKMNELSEAQRQAQQVVDQWAEAIGDMADVEDFNRNLHGVKNAPIAARSLFAQAAKDHGFVFNKEAGVYEVRDVLTA